MNDGLIYLDNNATTKIDPVVVEAIMPYITDIYGNPASSHLFGAKIKNQVEEARLSVSDLINANPKEIIFTSGATESLNLAIKGIAYQRQFEGKHIITSPVEHKAVLDACKYLESIGFEITYVPVNSNGEIDFEAYTKSFREDTIMAIFMLSNNETGVVNPIKQLAKIAHEKNCTFICDATQAVGKIPVDVNELEVDCLALSGHKYHAPKGIGALFVKNKQRLIPLAHGGGHENGLRSGTLNVPGIIGLGKASEIAAQQMTKNINYIKGLRDKLESELLKIEGAYLNGAAKERMYNVSNICFRRNEASVLMGRLKNIAVSNGSACTSSIVEPSHVLKAYGMSDEDAMASLRFSLSKFNTMDEINIVIDKLKDLIVRDIKNYA